MMRTLKIVCVALLVALAVLVGPPAIFLTRVWMQDGPAPMAFATAGKDDASRLEPNQPLEVIALKADPAEAETQLRALVRRATASHLHISISGAHHSMGGHTLYPGGLVLDMDGFRGMALDEKARLLTVGAGARWRDIIPYLDQRGCAVTIMQSNNDFSVGGSLSVNCHGWQNDSPPIASTVESFRLLTASGDVLRCSRHENRELFSLVLGGYGLFGVMLDVRLRVLPNEFYVAEAHKVPAQDYAQVYHSLTRGRSDVGMAYGRINVAPGAFMREGIITLLKRVPGEHPSQGTMTTVTPSLLKRLVFRGGAGSDYGKELRWWLENTFGETDGKVLSRNQIMNEASELYATRDPQSTDILHEYFIPEKRLGEFIEKARVVLLKRRPELLNVTVRNVERDDDTMLRYATEEVFGLVMLFDQHKDAASEEAMRDLTRDLIDVALSCGGRYYLPYRPHATQAQFLQAYPQARKFFALKKRYDPQGLFENSFYLNYGKS
jgi:FAD/FMN-containing dehydrogenase